jgi:hypothetical protein
MQIIPSDSAQSQPPKMGRPAHVTTPERCKQVEYMAALGLRQPNIALIMGISARSLRRRYRKQLDEGSAVAQKNVLVSLYEMALSQRNSAATIFWVKTRCGFAEGKQKPPKTRISQAPSKSLQPKPKRQSTLIGLTAELNDGAPNGEF